jgi:hypothetical protein
MTGIWAPEPDGSYQIHVKRIQFSTVSTVGELWIRNWRECFTLEDCVRKEKLPHLTAIPKGRYEIVVNYSNRFRQSMPLLLNVPGFEGIRIHPGNTEHDTDGCILVGKTRGIDFVGQSKAAYAMLFQEIQYVISQGKLFIQITEDRGA